MLARHIIFLYCNTPSPYIYVVRCFAGIIPKELGAFTKLKQLGLSENKLTAWAGFMTCLCLVATIPEELGLLTALVWLDLTSTKLTGEESVKRDNSAVL